MAVPAGRSDGGDDGEDDEAEHVVDHGSTEDDLRLLAAERSCVLQHARRDADARRAHGRADEQMHGHRGGGQEQRARADAEHAGKNHAEHRNGTRARRDLRHLAHARLETDLEEEQHHAQLCRERDLGAVGDRRKACDVEVSEQNADRQLAEDGRLTQPERQLTAELRGQNHGR